MALLLPTSCQVLFAPHRLFSATMHLERGIYWVAADTSRTDVQHGEIADRGS
jgi:hypothetical protein